MAINRKIKGFSGTEEEMKRIENVSENMGMTTSDIIHCCFKKLEDDPTMQEIIIAKYLEENQGHIGKDRLLRIMSIKKELKKERPRSINQHRGPVSVSNTYGEFNPNDPRFQELQRIAQAKWIEDDDEPSQEEVDKALEMLRSRKK